MKPVLTLLFLLIVNFSFAQNKSPLVKKWDRRFGGTLEENHTDMISTVDGGFIIAGYAFSKNEGDITQNNPDPSLQSADFWIVKVDSLGNKKWDKRYGGNSNEALVSIEQTCDKGFIMAGWSFSPVSGDKTQPTQAGSVDFWIVKTDSMGNKEWDKDYGGTNEDMAVSIHQTPDGGYIVGGYTASEATGDKTEPSRGNFDYWVLKLDHSGNKEWDRRFGGSRGEILYELAITADGGCILGGLAQSLKGGDLSQDANGNCWMVKVDALGNKQWDKVILAPPGSGSVIFSLKVATDGGFILASFTDGNIGGDKTAPSKGGDDYWIIKTDAQGNKQWDKCFGGREEEYLLGKIVLTSDGGYLFTGLSDSQKSGDKTEKNLGCTNIWVVKMDAAGKLQWDKTVATWGNDHFVAGVQSPNGGYAFSCATNAGKGGFKTQPNWNPSTDSAYCRRAVTTDYWIVKFDDPTAPKVPPKGMAVKETDTICAGNPFHLEAKNTSGNIQWQSSTDGTSFTNIPGATSPVLDAPNLNQTTYFRILSEGYCEVNLLYLETVFIDTASSPFDLGPDTTYCNTFDRVLSTGNPGTIWSTGEIGSQITTAEAGKYWATLSGSCGIYSDTIVLAVSNDPPPPPFSLGNDSTYCSSFTKTISTGINNTVWSTGETAPQITVDVSGIYWAVVNNGCGIATDTVSFSVTGTPDFSLGPDTTICTGTGFKLSVPVTAKNYLWSTGQVSSSIVPGNAGLYWVKAWDVPVCAATDSVTITLSPAPSFDLGPDSSFCSNTIYRLHVPAGYTGSAYTWQDGSHTDNIEVNKPGVYTLTISNGCGTYSDERYLDFSYDDCAVIFPNAFSPNGDGINDVFMPVSICNSAHSTYLLRVYNRWGGLLFESRDMEQGWNGLYEEIKMPLEVYVYYSEYFSPCLNKKVWVRGNVAILK